jgi:hypothetical protein
MIEDGVTPKPLSKDHFEIPSSKGDKIYIVSKYANKWQCTCPEPGIDIGVDLGEEWGMAEKLVGAEGI